MKYQAVTASAQLLTAESRLIGCRPHAWTLDYAKKGGRVCGGRCRPKGLLPVHTPPLEPYVKVSLHTAQAFQSPLSGTSNIGDELLPALPSRFALEDGAWTERPFAT